MQSNNQSHALLYILSSPRSGSTLLDFLLNSHPDIISVGEMRLLADYIRGRGSDSFFAGKCSCGVRVAECHFWETALRPLVARYGDIDAIETKIPVIVKPASDLCRGIFGRGLQGKLPEATTQQALGDCIEIYEEIFKRAGPAYIVDSSKHPDQLYHLKLTWPDRVKVLYLKRDLRAVAASYVKWNKKFNRQEKSLVRIMLGLTAFHLRSKWLLSAFDRSEVIEVAYKDLAQNYRETVSSIYRKLKIDASCRIEKTMSLEASHNIAGTPNRNKKKEIRYDTSWQELLEKSAASNIAGLFCNYIAFGKYNLS